MDVSVIIAALDALAVVVAAAAVGGAKRRQARATSKIERDGRGQ